MLKAASSLDVPPPPLGLDEIGSEINLRGRVILGVIRHFLLQPKMPSVTPRSIPGRMSPAVLWKGLDEIDPKPPLSLRVPPPWVWTK